MNKNLIPFAASGLSVGSPGARAPDEVSEHTASVSNPEEETWIVTMD
jgi:hypothetical protein